MSRRAWWLLMPVAAIAAVAATPFGSWVQSWFFGIGVRWQNAYVALDSAEANLPRDPRERERLLTANALADGAPPIGLEVGPRLHPAGTLARLRYDTFDENGAPLGSWEVRALVPTIGNGTGPFWKAPCGRACRDTIAASAGFRVRRSGEPGIAEEWVLRMPVGKAFELAPHPLQMQDILDARPRIVPLSSVRVDGRSLSRPGRILVTLVEACAARVRVGTTMNFEFSSDSVPVPRGFVTSRWAQVDGCGKLSPLPAPPPEGRSVTSASATPVPCAGAMPRSCRGRWRATTYSSARRPKAASPHASRSPTARKRASFRHPKRRAAEPAYKVTTPRGVRIIAASRGDWP